MEIKELQKRIHSNAVAKEFWEENFNISEKLMLVVSEISEAQEADLKDRYTKDSVQEVIRHSSDSDFKTLFEIHIKDTFEDEIADAVIRLFDLAEKKGFDLESHMLAKMRYNEMRPIKHGKKY